MSREAHVWEYRSNVSRSGAPVYVPFNVLLNLQGFQSVFGIPLEEAEKNTVRGSSAKSTYPVYCDTLLLDFDDCPDKAALAEEYLKQAKVAFLKFDSGNRSIHLHAAIEPMCGVAVPGSIKQWVSANMEGADTSFYHNQGMFRLPGTVHRKTGRKKLLLERVDGHRLIIPVLELRRYERGVGRDGEVADTFGSILEKMAYLTHFPPSPGNRHMSLWSLAERLNVLFKGEPDRLQTIETMLWSLNETWRDRKTRADIVGIVSRLS